MTDTNLPTNFDPDFANDQTEAFGSVADVMLSVDHEEKLWAYGGSGISDVISLVFIGKRGQRSLFSKDYDDLKPNETSDIVCRSADGMNGRGLGRRPHGLEDWRMQIEDRVCAKRQGNRFVDVCPMAKDFVCRPEMRVFGMVTWPDVDAWYPFFWNVRGIAAKPVRGAYQAAYRSHVFSKRMNEQTNKQEPLHPIWCWHYQVSLHQPNPRRRGLAPRFSQIVLLDQGMPDRELIDRWVRETGVQMWQGDVEAAKEQMAQVGEDDHGADNVEKVDEPHDNIPF